MSQAAPHTLHERAHVGNNVGNQQIAKFGSRRGRHRVGVFFVLVPTLKDLLLSCAKCAVLEASEYTERCPARVGSGSRVEQASRPADACG